MKTKKTLSQNVKKKSRSVEISSEGMGMVVLLVTFGKIFHLQGIDVDKERDNLYEILQQISYECDMLGLSSLFFATARLLGRGGRE